LDRHFKIALPVFCGECYYRCPVSCVFILIDRQRVLFRPGLRGEADILNALFIA